MPLATKLADLGHKSLVLVLAGATVGISTVVNRRLALKKEGRLQEELQRFGKESDIHAHTATTPTPLPNVGQPGRTGDDQ
ncbi:hypothetical protein BC936DRAFT_144516 [Jimgerdemannia flammicorona]|uniref:Uncharacterized protein n=1 Tax=Jimgerdemannia flammicorona TaxID=994334 RepID=A0A433DC96_9FUNG|nr:hypothetical protein BC936DRAFT_144516 [Jimgerdemannia flammicorona]